jgi:UDP-glucose 4-epimerase/UDP-glucuronate decarboxylase
MSRRVLVTGGAGFVGYHLSRALLEEPDTELTIADDLSRGVRDADLDDLLAADRVSLVTGDLTDPETWERIGGGYDEVFHLAAVIGVRHVLQRPADVLRVNALSTIAMLDWLVAGGGRRVVFSSTSEAYAWTQKFHPLPHPTPEDVPVSLTDIADPRSSYAGSKIFGELAVTHTCTAHGLPFAIVRFHNVYGPRMGSDHVIPELFARIVAGEDPLTVYSPTHRRAFCYVSDAVIATIAAMRADGADGGTFNVGNDREEIAIGDLAEEVIARSGRSVEIAAATAANDPIERRCPDITRAREVLGFEPRVPLDAGLELTLAWYARQLGYALDEPASPAARATRPSAGRSREVFATTLTPPS